MGVILRDDTFMTFEEARHFFKLSDSGLRKWIRLGRLPANCYWKPSDRGRYRFDRVKCEAWIRSRT